jgi:zinc protease
VVLSVVPRARATGRPPNRTSPAKRELPDYSKHDKVLAERPVKDDFDRSVQPKAAMR